MGWGGARLTFCDKRHFSLAMEVFTFYQSEKRSGLIKSLYISAFCVFWSFSIFETVSIFGHLNNVFYQLKTGYFNINSNLMITFLRPTAKCRDK